MRKRILAVAVAAATLASGANAAGFYLKEQSVVGQGRAFAGSAAGTDGASAAYFNPAGIVGLDRQVEVGVHVISPDVTVKDTGTTDSLGGALTGSLDKSDQSPYSATPVPNAHFVFPLDDAAIGISVGAPFGFGNEYGKNGFTAWDSVENNLSVMEISASYAKRVNESMTVSLGLVSQSLNLEQTAIGGSSTLSTLKGDSQDYGFVVGFQKTLGPSTVGLSYRSAVTHTVKGTQTFASRATGAPSTQAYPLASSGASLASTSQVSAEFALPDIFALGVAHNLTNETTVYGDVTYYGWSRVNSSPIKLSAASGPIPSGALLNDAQFNYNDTVSFSAGVEHNYSGGVTARAGIHFDPTPTNDKDRSTSTPDGDRTWLSAGLTKVVNKSLSLDAALTYILVEKGIVNKTRVLNIAALEDHSVTTKAKAEGNVGILSLGLRYKF